ncbi:MAG TPA: transposase [Candidatus Sulfotelmatobacter sp.]|nr:transposase [Candidatus Sulfotelmatobacter sp.]
MNHTSKHTSRKASQRRGELVSTKAVGSGSLAAAVSAPVPAPTLATPRRYHLIKLGVDTHGSSYSFGRKIDQQGIQPTQKLAPAKFLEFLQKQLLLARRVVMVYEAGPYGFALQRQASKLGVECLVCAPEKLSRGRRRANDKVDARELTNRLDGHLAGNQEALRLVHVPSLQQELQRRQGRERQRFRQERQRWMERGRSLFHLLGISHPGRWWEAKRRVELLELVQQRYGTEVRDQILPELDRLQEMLETMQKQLKLLSDALRKAGTARKAPRLKGIGPLSVEILEQEIGDWHRFKNRRAIASYTGLCGGEDSSGEHRKLLSIDKHGNPRVRAVLVELAWLLPRFQANYIRLQGWKWVFDPESKAGAVRKRKAVVALARMLAVDLWRIRTGRITPEEVGLELLAV